MFVYFIINYQNILIHKTYQLMKILVVKVTVVVDSGWVVAGGGGGFNIIIKPPSQVHPA